MTLEFKPFGETFEAVVPSDIGPVCLGYFSEGPDVVFIAYDDVWFEPDEMIAIAQKAKELQA